MIHDSRGLTPSRIPEVNVTRQDYGKGVLGLVLPACGKPAETQTVERLALSPRLSSEATGIISRVLKNAPPLNNM